MAARATLHALIDQLPDDKLDNVHMMLDHVLHPPPPTPEMEWLQQRNEELRTRFQAHVEQIRAGKKSGFTMASAGGSHFQVGHAREGHAECSQSWWEDRVHVRHHVILHAGHEVHLTERMHMTEAFAMFSRVGTPIPLRTCTTP